MLFRATLSVRESRLGPDHPDMLTNRNNLAFALTHAGRTEEAIPLLEATLRQRESRLGPDHPRTVTSRNNPATTSSQSRPVTAAASANAASA